MNRNGPGDRGGPYRRGLISDSYPSSCRRLHSKLISKERKKKKKERKKGDEKNAESNFYSVVFMLSREGLEEIVEIDSVLARFSNYFGHRFTWRVVEILIYFKTSFKVY